MGFDAYHPLINLIYFVSVICLLLISNHPVFVITIVLSGAIYLVWLKKKRAVIFEILMLALAVFFALFYSGYNHFGVTVIAHNKIGNAITLEAVIYGMILGLKLAGFFIWFAVINEVFTTDKVIYLLGKVSAGLALFVSISLRNIPRIRERYRQVKKARYGIGKRNIFKNIWIVIGYSIEKIMDVSASMKSRGIKLKRRKSYSIYRFETRDRCVVFVMVFYITVFFCAYYLNQLNILYNPKIIMRDFTVGTYIIAGLYLMFGLMPMTLEIRNTLAGKNGRTH